MSLNNGRGGRRSALVLPEDLLQAERRRFLKQSVLGLAFGGGLFTTPGLMAEMLTATHSSRGLEGPFYPDKLPLDTDNDLLLINDATTPAVGEITHLTGTVKTISGAPIRNAVVEIWQCDTNGSYLHSRGRSQKGLETNFQGYGRFLTGGKGEYYFRTIKPVRYSMGRGFRTPHIHFAVSKNGQRLFTTQMLIKDHPDNAQDGLTRRIDPKAKETILVDFKPLKDSKLGELAANFDIVVGRTIEELEDGSLRWNRG